MMGFAENLQTIRKRNGLTQEDLAEMLGVSRQAVSRWEQGEGYPEVEKLLLISEKLGVSMDGIMGLAELDGAAGAPSAESAAPQAGRAKAGDPARIISGVILTLCGLLFFFVPLFGFLQYISFPLFLAGLACLLFRRHTVLAAVWGVLFGADLYLRLINGAGWTVVFAPTALKENMNPQVLWMCRGLFVAGVVLMAITALVMIRRSESPLPIRENGSVDIKRIVIFVLIIAVILALFHAPVRSILGVDGLASDPENYESFYYMTRVANVARGITDSAAVALTALQLGKALSWIKQLLQRKRAKKA